MGLDGKGGGSEVRKERKRQLVLESSDSELDEYYISSRKKADATADGNAGGGGGGWPGEKVVDVGSDKVFRVKSLERDVSDKKRDELNRPSSEPDAKRVMTEAEDGSSSGKGISVLMDGNGGKVLRPGFPKWRFERAEIRGGRVLDGKDGLESKGSGGLKGKERASSLGRGGGAEDDKRRVVDQLRGEKQIPLKTDQGDSVNSDRQKAIRVQGKRGLLKLLPKNKKADGVTDDGFRQDEEKHIAVSEPQEHDVNGDKAIRVQGKRGLLKILPKNNNVDGVTGDGCRQDEEKHVTVSEPHEHDVNGDKAVRLQGKRGVLKLLPKNNKVDGVVDDGYKQDEGKHVSFSKSQDHDVNDDKKAIRVQGKRGLLKILPKNDKVDVVTGEGCRRDKEKHVAASESQVQDVNGEKKVIEKPISSIQLRRSDPSVEGVSLGQKMKHQNSKAHLKISSLHHNQPALGPKDENDRLVEHKNVKKRLLEHKALPEKLSKKTKSKAIDLLGVSGSGIKRHGMKKPRAGDRNKVKRELRDQIKRMLLDNGWKIELRPRKGKDYEDSVYVSPQVTSYWSITKAYAVFQEQLKNSQDQKRASRSSKLGNLEPGGAHISYGAISKDDLAMLKRNVVNKRRTREELDMSEKKYEGSRSRNTKDSFTGRHSRNVYLNDDNGVKIKHRGCALLVRGSTNNREENMDDYIPYEWKRTIFSWMIDLGVLFEDAKIKYMNKRGTRIKLEGRVTREGIYCGCCSKILTVAKFELHAGSKEQQPFENIFLEDGGVSLLQCLHDAWEKQSQHDRKGFYEIDAGDDPDDDTCGICGDGGDLICCDHCPSTFHLTCLEIQMPSGDWYCRNCTCRFCGVSLQERTSSFAELLPCLQCKRKYHQDCAPGSGKEPANPDQGFCSPGCRKIHKRLHKLLGVRNDMEAGLSWSLVRCFADCQSASTKRQARRVQCNSKTAVAFSVMDECFLPIIDERSGINVIHNVIYNCGSNFKRLDFSGFYTFIMERGDEVISTASVRIHGTDLAEMPFIGTRDMYRQQGMCRRLLNAIELVLSSLNVQRLVIPAISELKDTWTTVFGFKPVGLSKKQKIQCVNLLIFHDTGLLEKWLLPTNTVNEWSTGGPANTVECDKKDAQMSGEASGSLTPVHISREVAVDGHLEIKDHQNSNPPPASEENELKTSERTSPLSVGDANLHTLLGVGSEDNMQCKAEVDNTQEGKDAGTDGATLIEIKTIAEQNSSNERGKGKNCPSSKLSVEGAVVRVKSESNLNFNSSSDYPANHEEKDYSAITVDAGVSLVDKDQKNDNYELKAVVAAVDIQNSAIVKDLQDKTNMVSGTSMDTCIAKDQAPLVGSSTDNAVDANGDHCISAVDHEASVERSVQQKAEDTHVCGNKISVFSPDLKPSSMNKEMPEKSNETNFVADYSEQNPSSLVGLESHKIDIQDAAVDMGVDTSTVESSRAAGVTARALDISNDIYGEVMAKPSQTCGNNSMVDDLASGKAVNA